METPSSNRRITRSQTKAALNNSNIRKIEDSGEKGSKTLRRNGIEEENRCALIDITNDSPIVGVAMSRSETPLQRSNRISKMIKTPGSGEALLRGQVKALLQKVEEEGGEHVTKISIENRPFLHLQGFVNSPTGLLAPTPANTPQIPNLSGDNNDDYDNNTASFTPLPVIQEQLKICQVMVGEIIDGNNKEGSIESEKSVTRSLFLDFFSEQSESEISSVVTKEEDSASNWSIQVNASSRDGEYEDEDYVEEEEDYDEDEGGEWIDEVCEGIGKISISSKFEGKHKKFEYNSDDEIVVEEETAGSILRLKGLPTPKGKHLRFPSEEQED
ncbi:Chalcone-flavanone isomerase family protein [Euphorbia peplus]|nr:Chalcone-flavanone isomerase family protein [Euphorbia peplus]